MASFLGLAPDVASRLCHAYGSGVDKLNPCEKADLARVLADREPLDWGTGEAQSFGLLHDLRNALIHHKPITVEHGKPASASDDKLERKLHRQFQNARIWDGRGANFRWYGCMGGPCAAWAHSTAVGFGRTVAESLGIRLAWLA